MKPQYKSDSAIRAFPASRALDRAMRRALRKQKKAGRELTSEPVHDVRVAIRRCRSLAEGFSTLEAAPVWRRLRKTCKKQARGLTDLRDLQVLAEWVKRLHFDQGDAGEILLGALHKEERRARREARKSLKDFPRKRWKRWRRVLPEHAELIPVGQARLAALAWERITEVCNLDQRWRRSRSATAWHRLRVAVKRFRYVMESFLPEQYAAWEKDLIRTQDLLGEGHDLDVLRERLIELAREKTLAKGVREGWLERIERERTKRANAYAALVSGKATARAREESGREPRQSLWDRWREELGILARLNLATGAGLAESRARRASHATGRSLPRPGTRLRTSSTQ